MTRIKKYLGWREPNKSKWLHWKAILVRFTCGISLLFTVAAGRPRRHFSLWVLPLWSKYYCWRLHKWAGTEIPTGLQESAISCAFFVCRREQIEVNHSSNTSGCCCCCCMLPCDLTVAAVSGRPLGHFRPRHRLTRHWQKSLWRGQICRYPYFAWVCVPVLSGDDSVQFNGQCNNAVTPFRRARHPLCPPSSSALLLCVLLWQWNSCLHPFPLAHPPYLPRVHCPYLLVILESTASAHILQLLHKPSTLPHRRAHTGKSDHFPPSCLQCKQRHSYLLTTVHVAPVANLSEKLSWSPAV